MAFEQYLHVDGEEVVVAVGKNKETVTIHL